MPACAGIEGHFKRIYSQMEINFRLEIIVVIFARTQQERGIQLLRDTPLVAVFKGLGYHRRLVCAVKKLSDKVTNDVVPAAFDAIRKRRATVHKAQRS